IREYLPFIKAEVFRTTQRVVDENQSDELAIAMVGFHDAIQSYSRHRGAFIPYAGVIIRRRVIDFLRREKKHSNHISLDEHGTLLESKFQDHVQTDPQNSFEYTLNRQLTEAEIAELTRELKGFGMELNDIADNCPTQERNMDACQRVLQSARAHPVTLDTLRRTRQLPVKQLAAVSGVHRKTIERYRKYLVCLMIIFSNGYELLRGHLVQIPRNKEGGIANDISDSQQ
ncbi:MAG TPA: sigma factor, partial [Bacteroidales bacterium]|nr:sigma factor [Bacteroidales bacterium]